MAEPPSYDACRLSSSNGAGGGSGIDVPSPLTTAADAAAVSSSALFPQPLPGAAPLTAAAISKIKGKIMIE